MQSFGQIGHKSLGTFNRFTARIPRPNICQKRIQSSMPRETPSTHTTSGTTRSSRSSTPTHRADTSTRPECSPSYQYYVGAPDWVYELIGSGPLKRWQAFWRYAETLKPQLALWLDGQSTSAPPPKLSSNSTEKGSSYRHS